MNQWVSRDYVGRVRVGRGLLYVGPGRNSLIEPAEAGEAAERDSLAEALHRPGPEPSTQDVIEEAMEKAEKITSQVERAASIAEFLTGDLDLAALAPEVVDGLLAALDERYRDSQFRVVLRLARVLASILMLAKRWRDLVWTLKLAQKAALKLGDVAGEAWAQHELGTLNVAAGNRGAATELLGDAEKLAKEAGDHAAAELSSHNLQQFDRIWPPQGVLQRITQWSAAHKAVILAAGAIALAGAAGAYALTGGDGEPGKERREDGRGGGGGEDGGSVGGGGGGGGGSETAAIDLSTTSLDFGSVPVGEGIPARQYTITSVASEPITLGTIQQGGSDPKDFPPDDSCSGTTLEPGASCSVVIVFVPQGVGPRSASSTLNDPANGETRQVTMSGTGTRTPGTTTTTTPPAPTELAD